MANLLIVFAVITVVLLIVTSLYMVKTRVIINDQAYDALVWVVSCLIVALPIMIAMVEALAIDCGKVIIIVLSGVLALCEEIVMRSKSNYKMQAEDGDADYREVSSDDPEEILDELTVLEGSADGSDNCCE